MSEVAVSLSRLPIAAAIGEDNYAFIWTISFAFFLRLFGLYCILWHIFASLLVWRMAREWSCETLRQWYLRHRHWDWDNSLLIHPDIMLCIECRELCLSSLASVGTGIKKSDQNGFKESINFSFDSYFIYLFRSQISYQNTIFIFESLTKKKMSKGIPALEWRDSALRVSESWRAPLYEHRIDCIATQSDDSIPRTSRKWIPSFA